MDYGNEEAFDMDILEVFDMDIQELFDMGELKDAEGNEDD